MSEETCSITSCHLESPNGGRRPEKLDQVLR